MERMTASLKLECQRRKQLERDSLSCAWGHVLRYDDNGNGQEQRVFYSVSSAGKNDPHRIVLGNVHVPYPYTCPPEEVERGTFPAGGITMDSFISHMGEVNRIRLFSRFPHVLATSSDDELVRVFTTSKADKDPYKPPCEPDLRLVDNQERAPFALATSQIGSSVASGTSTGERVVRVWDIEDHVSAGLVNKHSKGSTEVRARSLFKGHQKEIEDVCFHPSESDKLASVAEDGTLMLYDARKGSSPARAVKFEGHPANLRCVDWNTRDPNHVAIGDADGVLRILDLRNPAKDLIKAHEHSGELLSVRWNPADSKILMTGGEDCFVNLWITRQEASRMPDGSKPIRHKMLLLSYKSNGRVQETVWNPTSAHCVLNVSTGDGEESSSVDNNGTINNSSSFLEVWRPWDMIFLSETDAIARIRNLWDRVAI